MKNPPRSDHIADIKKQLPGFNLKGRRVGAKIRNTYTQTYRVINKLQNKSLPIFFCKERDTKTKYKKNLA